MLKYFRIVLNLIRRRRNLKLNRNEVVEMQLKKFRRLVKFANLHSPYYAEIIARLKIDIAKCRPEDFPVMDKKTLLNNFDRIITDKNISLDKIKEFLEKSKDPAQLYLDKYVVIHSSGSSGLMGYFVYTIEEFSEGMNTFVGKYKSPSIFRRSAFLGTTDGHYAGVSMFIFYFLKVLSIFGGKKYKLFDINCSFEDIVRQMNEFQPTYIIGYAFGLKKLAEYQKAGELKIKPEGMASSGETLSYRDRSFIKSVFSVSVEIIYSSSEMLVSGIKNKREGEMILLEDNIYFEIKEDKVLMTSLFNYTLPLIRYEMLDKLEVVEKTEKETSFTRINGIVGRQENMPYFLNDNGKIDFISPTMLMSSTFSIKGLNQFQMRIIDKQNFDFLIILDVNLVQEEREKIKRDIILKWKEILQKKQMTKVNFELKEADALGVDKVSGKFRLIV